MTSTVTMPRLSDDQIKGIALVGQIVTYGDRQFKVHSVEGRDWYAFDDNGTTTVDLNMTPARWIFDPIARITPSDSVLGEGRTREVKASALRRGVCLEKAWV